MVDNQRYPLRDILRMDALAVQEMWLEGADEAFGEHPHPVFHAFAISHDDLTLGNVQVFDAQSQAFHQPQPATIQQLGSIPWFLGHKDWPSM